MTTQAIIGRQFSKAAAMTAALLALVVILVSGAAHALEGAPFLDSSEAAIHASAELGEGAAELTVGHSCATHCAAHTPLGSLSSVQFILPPQHAKAWSPASERALAGRSPPRAERPPRV